MADIARNPAFDAGETTRVREQRLARLSQALASPNALASREIGRLLFGAHPYAQPGDGLGDRTSLAAISPADLRKAHGKWLRPGRARITVVGDTTMADLLPRLEAAFGDWRASAMVGPQKRIDAAIPAPAPRIVVIDRPNSPQSVVLGGRVLPLTGKDSGMEALDLANEVLGAGFLSRLNLDLREEKGWSYGVRSGISRPEGPRTLTVRAPVQADRTGDTIRTIIALMQAFPGKAPVTNAELERVTVGNVRSLPNRFETNYDVLGAVIANDELGRPDDYYETLADRWMAVDDAAIDAAARQYLAPEGLTFVVVGERAVVEPQLADIGLPVEYVDAPAAD
jgi:predicted Zn-dependent peptidase